MDSKGELGPMGWKAPDGKHLNLSQCMEEFSAIIMKYISDHRKHSNLDNYLWGGRGGESSKTWMITPKNL